VRIDESRLHMRGQMGYSGPRDGET
jgi:hypothetical protein